MFQTSYLVGSDEEYALLNTVCIQGDPFELRAKPKTEVVKYLWVVQKMRYLEYSNNNEVEHTSNSEVLRQNATMRVQDCTLIRRERPKRDNPIKRQSSGGKIK
jgi:hypothetical protein